MSKMPTRAYLYLLPLESGCFFQLGVEPVGKAPARWSIEGADQENVVLYKFWCEYDAQMAYQVLSILFREYMEESHGVFEMHGCWMYMRAFIQKAKTRLRWYETNDVDLSFFLSGYDLLP